MGLCKFSLPLFIFLFLLNQPSIEEELIRLLLIQVTPQNSIINLLSWRQINHIVGILLCEPMLFLQGILINGQFPGPDIYSQTNDNLIINVYNSLPEPFLLSW